MKRSPATSNCVLFLFKKSQKREKIRKMLTGHEDMKNAKEKAAVELMKAGTRPKDAMQLSGCNYTPGDTNYRRVTKRFYRWEAKKEREKKEAKLKELKTTVQKQTKELQSAAQRRTTVQQFRREANAACAELNISKFKQKEMSRALAKLDKKYATHLSPLIAHVIYLLLTDHQML